MIILSDTRQQSGKHNAKEEWFARNGIEIRRTKLYFGDYTLPTDQSICIDTKENILEIINNVCGAQHERFIREIERAEEVGAKLIFIIENKGEFLDSKKTIWQPTVRSLEDLYKWRNKRSFIWRGGKQLYPNATKGSTIAKALTTIELKHPNVKFLFTTPEESGALIYKILTTKEV